MKKKLIGIFIVTLFLVTVMLPIVGSEIKNVQYMYDNKNVKLDSISDDCGCIRNDEFNEVYLSFPVMDVRYEPLDPLNASPKPKELGDLPEYFNWMNYEGKDWTSPVKNQGNCGSCWDFAAIGALESIINIRENNPELDLDLSEQYVMSCLPTSGSCGGGVSYFAFNNMKEFLIGGAYYNGALPESCFPYVGVDIYGNNYYEGGFDPVLCLEKCDNWNEQLIPIKDCGYWIPDGSKEDRDAIKTQIMQYGPVCAHIYVTDYFKRWGNESHNATDYYPYKSANGVNHVVVIVGWKDDASITKGGYWIIKNSYGVDWGYNGFFNLEYTSLNIEKFEIVWVDYDANRSHWSPNKPIIDGTVEAGIEEECAFSTSTSDPINREIQYQFDWGDGSNSDWLGPYESGNLITLSHSWNEKGLYQVRVKAKNSDNVESQWSDCIIVHIPKENDGTDQKQTKYQGGYRCSGMSFAQSFIPLENTFTMVSLYMQKVGDAYSIRISIRDELDRMDLTFIECDAENISDTFSWHEFDFPDINVIPGKTYYIVWTPYASDLNNTFKWGFAKDNQYPDGCAWQGFSIWWEEIVIPDYPDLDFCFKTYYAKSKSMSIYDYNPFQQFLENHPYLFLFLRQLINVKVG